MLNSISNFILISIFLYVGATNGVFEGVFDQDESRALQPTVLIAVLVRNKAHVLPWSLHYIENLNYPKDRIYIWIRSDHNEDDSSNIVGLWLSRVQDLYHQINFHDDKSTTEYAGQKGPMDWTKQRIHQVIKLRQEALDTARKIWADYLMFVDADNFLTNPEVLNDLIAQNKVAVSPLLVTSRPLAAYSNFWAGMNEQVISDWPVQFILRSFYQEFMQVFEQVLYTSCIDTILTDYDIYSHQVEKLLKKVAEETCGYYERTERYEPILKRLNKGCHSVPMIHSVVLINMKDARSKLLSYITPPPDYSGPLDDIIIFASVARHHSIPLHILNTDFYGYLLEPASSEDPISLEQAQFMHLRTESIIAGTPLERLPYIPIMESSSKLGFDKVYVINLKRRADRYKKMHALLSELALEADFVEAVDGRELNDTYLEALGIQMLPGYLDPYHKRPMKMGEIGCFLSHYKIWQDIVENNYKRVLILEDDVRFTPYFKINLAHLLDQVNALNFQWDLIYMGRKKLKPELEFPVDDDSMLVWPHYSYWTIGYMLNEIGASKLLEQRPLTKLVPVDEYLPIMFDKHPEEAWKSAFEPRDLVALSVQPFLIEPAYYIGQPEYVTDTEDSVIIAGPVKTSTTSLPENSHQHDTL